MLQSVAHNEPLDSKPDIVSAYLLEDLLSDVDIGRLVLDNHQWLSLFAIDNRVATLLRAVQGDGHLVANALCRIAFLTNQEVDELLPNPFLGRQSHIFAPQNVKNMRLPGLCRDLKLSFRKVKYLHIDFFRIFAAKLHKR
jgi:hypothetical protein